ncbi:hypothetical protein [Nannocystis pusilla]|uniref:hypothetical protein n=1 Tax=Nannocystis pusilla TaxID=889268 RepID=UPI003DA24CF0
MSDPSRIPARVLALLASVTGHGLSLHAASAAAGSVALDPEDWSQSTARAARQAGLKAARFTVDTAEDVRRLCALESPACSRVGDRWLVLMGARRGVLDLVTVDELVLVRALLARPRLLLLDLGLDRLGLSAARRGELLDWIVDPRRPWTLVVVTDSVDSGDVLSRCEHQRVLVDC